MSGSIDASIPLQAGKSQAPANPLQQFEQYAQAQNAINALKMFPGQQRLQQQAIQGGQSDLVQKQRQLGAAGLAPLLADPGNLSLDTITSRLGALENSGVVTAPMLGELTNLPHTGDPAKDNATYRAWILANAQPAHLAAAAVTPTQGQFDTGPNIQPFTRGAPGMPDQGVVAPVGQSVTKSTSPETQAAETPVWVQMPDNTWVQKPQARSARPGANGQPSPAIPGNGAYVPRGAAQPSSPALSSPPMGVGEDIAAYKKDQQAIPNIQTGLTNLQTAKEALALTNTGRSSEAVHNFYSFLKTQGISPSFIDGDVTNYDIARKAMLQFASSQGAAAGTDLGLDTALHSNASVDIDPAAANHVINQNIGLQRMKIAQVMESPKGGNGYGSHVTKFANENDPRAFAWDAYTPNERTKILAEVSKTKGGLDKFDHSLEIAANHGLLNIPSQQQAATPAPSAPASAAPAPGFVPGQ